MISPAGSALPPEARDRRSKLIRRAVLSLLADGYRVRAKARGESMAPLIRRDDLLTVRPAAFAGIRVGDIVAYRTSPRHSVLTTHRVIRKITHGGKTWLVAMGDANRFLDGPLDRPEMVLGVLVKIERNGRILSLETPLRRLGAYLRARLMLALWILRRCLLRST